MRTERAEEAGVEHLDAAVFEQRRLSHMLRRRGAEIESLRGDRERLALRERKALEREEELRRRVDELKQKVDAAGAERDRLNGELKRAEYEARRAERRVAQIAEDSAEALKKTEGESAEALKRVEDESAEAHERGERRLEEARRQLATLTSNRDRLATELKQAEYEARRAERRRAKTEREAIDARRRDRLRFESLRAELRESLSSRDRALKREQKVLIERDEILDERDEALADRNQANEALELERLAATDEALGIEATALELGRARREVELLVDLERGREVLLAGSERSLDEVAENLRRVRASRSWRWGHAVARALRTVTFRRRSERSALDGALERLGADRGSQIG